MSVCSAFTFNRPQYEERSWTKRGLDVVCAVHLTNNNEGRQGVDLLPDIVFTKHITRVARTIGQSRAEERHALLRVPAKAMILPGNLSADQSG